MQRHAGGDRAAIHLRLRVLGGILLLAHLALVGWVTLRPLDVPWAAAANLTPLEGIRTDLGYGPLEAARRIGSSLVLLAPLGVLLPWVSGRLAPSPLAAWSSLLRTTTAGALISLVLAMLQSGVPGQVVDVDHILLNTVGVALAHLAVVPALRSRMRRGRAGKQYAAGSSAARASDAAASSSRTSSGASGQGSTPRIPRVGLGLRTEVLSAIHREY
ncbi:VanZ family protein [Streptomyces antimicrobicus]|uniref:VanZ family protein n=1 Tax=Streptomyces antimicrobicus TaxID=2883108 RepID=A0ABS8B1P2_9ACTN|nr:VanZ family protein [Streptomyces antimicrobicus]MCB5178515.1 VanZ family protein [Streptomyces antimicrobicus]